MYRSPYVATTLRVGFLLALLFLLWQALAPTPVVRAPINDKLLHFLAFFVLALLADCAWLKTRFGWRHFAGLALYGGTIEVLQYFVPGRSFSLLDLLADLAGVLVYWWLVAPWVQRLAVRIVVRSY